MSSNYQTAKFLANERVKDHLAIAKNHRYLKISGKQQERESVLKNTSRQVIAASQKLIGNTASLVNAVQRAGNAITATR